MEFSEPEVVAEDVEFEMLSDSIDHKNLDVSVVVVVNTESDEVDAEFVDAMTEIEGKQSFPCPTAQRSASQKEA